MRIYGYHRMLRKEKGLECGIQEITDYCNRNRLKLTKIFSDEKFKNHYNGEKYQFLKEKVLCPKDELIVTQLECLGCNRQGILKELQYFKDNGIRIKILELPTTLMDTSKMNDAEASMIIDTIHNMLIETYTSMVREEYETHKKPQMEGIQAMKERGDATGRPMLMDLNKFWEQYQRVLQGELESVELMKKLSMKRSTYYRYVQLCKGRKFIS